MAIKKKLAVYVHDLDLNLSHKVADKLLQLTSLGSGASFTLKVAKDPLLRASRCFETIWNSLLRYVSPEDILSRIVS